MTLNKILPLLLLSWLTAAVNPALAVDCGLNLSVAEYTVCNNPQLLWLDRLYNDVFHQRVAGDPQHAARFVAPRQETPWCTNTRCLRDAYLKQIGQLYGADRPFDWEGTWWNTTAPSGNSGNILINGDNGQLFHMDASVRAVSTARYLLVKSGVMPALVLPIKSSGVETAPSCWCHWRMAG